MFRKIAIIGPGQIGTGIAQVAAATGHLVVLNGQTESDLKRAKNTMERNLKQDPNIRRMKANDQKNKISEIISNIEMTTDLSSAVKDVDLVVESVEENLSKKQEIFTLLDKICPKNIILAHHSQSLTIAEISEKMENKFRFGGVQFYNPVHISKNVKIIKCISTSQETFEKLDTWGAGMGKETVRCIDTPDFIIQHGISQDKKTRLLFPYMMEALREIEHNDVKISDVDAKMKFDSNLPMGPFELMDYIGLDTVEYVIAGWHRSYPHEELYNPSTLLSDLAKAKKKFL